MGSLKAPKALSRRRLLMSRKYTTLPWTEYYVAYGRFDTTRAPIDRIVLHTTVGTMQSMRNLFASNPPAGKETSATYGISYEGNIDAYLEEYYTAYHCGNYGFNQRSIGIEHEDKGAYNSPRPDALYTTSAKLVADICKFYNIPCDSAHIFKHNGVPGSSTSCPNSLDTNRIIREAKAIIDGTTPTPIPPMDAEIKRQANLFGVFVHRLISDSTDPKTVLEDQVTGLCNSLKAKSFNSDKWEALCSKAVMAPSSTFNQLYEKIKSLGQTGITQAQKDKIKDYVQGL